MKVKRDVITSITASLVAVTLVIICVLTFITGVIVFIGKCRNVFDVTVSRIQTHNCILRNMTWHDKEGCYIRSFYFLVLYCLLLLYFNVCGPHITFLHGGIRIRTGRLKVSIMCQRRTATCLCLSQARTWISNFICCGLICVLWVQLII
jgi:hypothetical protein